MTRLLQIFGFFSVLFRGATLSLQSLTIGGIAFLLVVVGRSSAESETLRSACLRWIRRAALALAVMQVVYVLANALILMQSTDMTFAQVSGATFAIAGVLASASALTIAALAGAPRSRGHAGMLLPAAVILVSSVMTSHSVARLEYRVPLTMFTALHQAATATWLGGLPYLLIGLRGSPDLEFARQLTARFSKLALCSVAVLATAGLTLSLAYVGSLNAIYGTSYGIMVAAKVVLFGILLLLGALNFQIVHRSQGAAAIASLRRFGEAEIGIGITVILTAASLTSLPPAADLQQGRVSAAEIVARISPRQSPRSSRRHLRQPAKVHRCRSPLHRLFYPGPGGHAPQHSRGKVLVRIQPSLGRHHCPLHWIPCSPRASWPCLLGSKLAADFPGALRLSYYPKRSGDLAPGPQRLLGYLHRS